MNQHSMNQHAQHESAFSTTKGMEKTANIGGAEVGTAALLNTTATVNSEKRQTANAAFFEVE